MKFIGIFYAQSFFENHERNFKALQIFISPDGSGKPFALDELCSETAMIKSGG